MNIGRVYIAARYSRRNEMRKVAAMLADEGFRVTSRWLSEDKPLETKLGDDSPEFYTDTAQVDLEDIREADTVMFFAEDPLTGTPRGGRHVEFGYALGIGRRIVVISGPENIFHYLPGIKHFPSVQSFLDSEAA